VPAHGHVEIQEISLGLQLGPASESSVVGKEHVQDAFVENGFVPEYNLREDVEDFLVF